jgi:hypothetical protein
VNWSPEQWWDFLFERDMMPLYDQTGRVKAMIDNQEGYRIFPSVRRIVEVAWWHWRLGRSDSGKELFGIAKRLYAFEMWNETSDEEWRDRANEAKPLLSNA